MKTVLATAPTFKPVSVLELTEHCRLGDCARDYDYLRRLRDEAVEEAESFTWRRLCAQTWDHYVDRFSDPIVLPYPPASSVTSVKYYDNSDVQQTLSTSVYELGDRYGVGTVRLQHDQTWPSGFRGHIDDIVIRFVCGWATAATVPGPIRRAIEVYVGHCYRNREGGQVPPVFYDLLSPYLSPEKLATIYQ
ncbi:MAG TPA: hypothetical protein VMY37_24370 [Thermoguttaceae bacterium]|nr:hypothetical protein [Thermoguttaceae bacterium]